MARGADVIANVAEKTNISRLRTDQDEQNPSESISGNPLTKSVSVENFLNGSEHS